VLRYRSRVPFEGTLATLFGLEVQPGGGFSPDETCEFDAAPAETIRLACGAKSRLTVTVTKGDESEEFPTSVEIGLSLDEP
jgi:hypothetical protein